MEEKKSDGGEVKEENEENEEEEMKDVEKGEVGFHKGVVENNNYGEFQLSRMQRLNPSNPLRIVINSATRVPTTSPSQRPSQPPPPHARAQPPPPPARAHPPPPPAHAQPRSTPAPTPQVS